MLRKYGLFIASVILVIFISWANVDFFGTHRTNTFGPMVNQVVHLVAFFITGIIGYINWRKHDKWVVYLWVGAYALALLVFMSSAAIFQFTGNITVKRVGVGIRNRFTEPILLLVVFIIVQAYDRLIPPQQSKK